MSNIRFPDGFKTPFWFQKLQWIFNPIGYMETASMHFGDIFNAPVMGDKFPLVFVSNPNVIHQIFSNDTKKFVSTSHELLRPLVGDHSLFTLEDEHHLNERKMIMPLFRHEKVQRYGQIICELTRETIDSIASDQTFSAHLAVQNISMEVILRAVFGVPKGKRFDQLREKIDTLLAFFQSPIFISFLYFSFLQKKFGFWSPWGYISQLQQQIDSLIYSEIEERRRQSFHERSDILSLLLSIHDEAGKEISDECLRDELVTILFAGRETTATAIAWSLYWVYKKPEVRSRLLEELRMVRKEQDLTEIIELPYLTAVCKETLRIYPASILTVPRIVKEDVDLFGGYSLQAGTIVFGCIYLVHHREDLYPKPNEFRPERFLERQFSFYEFLPFGGGIHKCIGESLALLEMKLVLATILLNYDLKLASNTFEKPRRRGVQLAPGRGVKMITKIV